MGSGKKEASRRERQGKTGDGMSNVRTKGENFYRDAKRVKQLNMFKEGKAQRNARGEITKAATYQSKEIPTAVIHSSRNLWSNSRVISQEALATFRENAEKTLSDPYSYLLRQNKLPMSLIRDNTTKNGVKQHAAKIAVETRPFSDTFGPKAQRKRVKMGVSSIEDLAGASTKMHDEYLDRREQADLLSGNSAPVGEDRQEAADVALAREPIFSKGQSKRIWNELYKVIDSSDVIIHVLDARDPEGTRCRSVEKYIREEAPHKHLLFVLNKCDLVPTSIAAAWVRILSKDYPTLAFHASITNSFGKGSLIAVLRQFSILHNNRKQISVGLIGYPNTGKSSIINTLRKKKVTKVAPIPGETKIWQYVTLMKRIYLIDCPGIVPPNAHDSPEDILLKGVVRVENVQNPEQYVAAALRKCKAKHVQKTYEVGEFSDATEFLEACARKSGRLLKGGEADVDGVAKMVLNDFLRGKLPWYTAPPASATTADGKVAEGVKEQGRTGDMARLNKLPTADLRARKRKRDDEDGEDGEDGAAISGVLPGFVPATKEVDVDDEDDDDDFEGFTGDEDEDDDEDSEDEEQDASDEVSKESDLIGMNDALLAKLSEQAPLEASASDEEDIDDQGGVFVEADGS